MKNLKLNKTVTWAFPILMLALGCNPSRIDNKEQIYETKLKWRETNKIVISEKNKRK